MDTEPVSNCCPKCQAPLPADAPQGLCPKCLLAAVATPTEAGQPPGHRPAPPPLAEIAAAFPQLEILEFIGQGGMGFVFKARQPKLDRLVALKILPQSLSADPTFAERFNREARLLARLSHPGIVTVHDFGVTSDQPSTIHSQPFYYLLMEYVDGVNLRQAMQAGRFTPNQALAIVPKICEALQFAHNEGILHRDIKPENILLDAKGRVKLADFGIAKLIGTGTPSFVVPPSGGPIAPEPDRLKPAPRPDALTEAGKTLGTLSFVVPPSGGPIAAEPDRLKPAPRPDALTEAGKTLGTPNYMAPEQLERPGEVDHRADIYSLGVVFYEMLTGELPLGRFAPPSQRSAADPRVDEVVLRALEKEKSKRPASADEVRTQVETITSRSSGRESAQTENRKAESGKQNAPLKSERGRMGLQDSSGAAAKYPSLGELALHSDRLVVSCGYQRRTILLSDIHDLGQTVMPWWFSPAGHCYAGVEFDEAGRRCKVAFMPGASLFRTVADSRQQSAEWLAAIQLAVKSATGRELPINRKPAVMPIQSLWSLLFLMILVAIPGLLLLTKLVSPNNQGGHLAQGILMVLWPLLILLPIFAWRFWSVHFRNSGEFASRSSGRESAQTGSFGTGADQSLVTSAATNAGRQGSRAWLFAVIALHGLGFIALAFFCALIVPHFKELLAGFLGAKLPPAARLIISASDLVRSSHHLLLAVLLGLDGVICWRLHRLAGRKMFATWAVTIPAGFVLLIVLSLFVLYLPVMNLAYTVRGPTPVTSTQTTPNLSFGPVIERVVHAPNDKRTECLDLDTGNILDTPFPVATNTSAFSYIHEKGGDLLVEGENLVGPELSAASRPESDWESLPANKVAAPLQWTVGANAHPAVLRPHQNSFATWVFRTSAGNVGLLQITGFTENPRGVKLRYKLVQDAPAQITPAAIDQSLSFGPVMERVVAFAETNSVGLLDLDTGKTVAPPKEFWACFAEREPMLWEDPAFQDKVQMLEKWFQNSGADMVASPRTSMLDFYNTAVGLWRPSFHSNLFDVVTADSVAKRSDANEAEQNPAMRIPPISGIDIRSAMRSPTSLIVFKTRDGGRGVMQITGFTDNPRGVKLRYKLVQNRGPIQANSSAVQAKRTFSSFDQPSTPAGDDNWVSEIVHCQDVAQSDGAVCIQSGPLRNVLLIYESLSGRTVIHGTLPPVGGITLRLNAALSRVQVLQLFDTVLAENGIAMVLSGDNAVKAVPVATAVSENPPEINLPWELLPDSSSPMSRTVPLKNISAVKVAPMLAPLSKLPNSMTAVHEPNLLLLRDYSSSIRQQLKLLEIVDQNRTNKLVQNGNAAKTNLVAVQAKRTFSSFDQPSTPAGDDNWVSEIVHCQDVAQSDGAVYIQSGPLRNVLLIYESLSGRTVIHGTLPPVVGITLRLKATLSRAQVLQVFDTALAEKGIAMVLSGDNAVKAVPVATAGSENLPEINLPWELLPDSSSPMSQTVPLKNIRAVEVVPMLAPLSKLSASIVPIQNQNLLILRDYSSCIRQELRLLETLEQKQTNALSQPPDSAVGKALAERAARDEFQFRWVAADKDTNSPVDILPAAGGQPGQPPLRVLRGVILSSLDVESAGFSQYQSEQKELEVFLDPRGGEKFAKATAENIGRQLAIVWRDRVISAPIVRSEIPGRRVAITARLTDAEAQLLLDVLNHRVPAQRAAAQNHSFGPVIERVVHAPNDKRTECLDLDTGIILATPFPVATNASALSYIHEKGGDLLVEGQNLVGPELSAADRPESDWESLPANKVAAPLQWTVGANVHPAVLRPHQNSFATWVFRTSAGNVGLLQITGFTENPRGVKLRYKLVQGSPARLLNVQPVGTSEGTGTNVRPVSLKPIPPEAAQQLKLNARWQEDAIKQLNRTNPPEFWQLSDEIHSRNAVWMDSLRGTVAEPLLQQFQTVAAKMRAAQEAKDTVAYAKAEAESVGLCKALGALIEGVQAREGAANSALSSPAITGPPFTARLPVGEVELVGVSEFQKSTDPSLGITHEQRAGLQKTWWRPDGAELTGAIPCTTGSLNQRERNIYEVALRVRGQTNGVPGVDLETIPDSGAHPAGLSGVEWAPRVEDMTFQQTLSCEAGLAKASVRIGVATETWRTQRRLDFSDVASAGGEAGDITLSVVAAGEETVVTCRYEQRVGWQTRLIAIGPKGEIAPIRNGPSHGTGNSFSETRVFRTTAIKDANLHLQRRSYHWVEFHNVSLKPGGRTQLEILDSPAQSRDVRESLAHPPSVIHRSEPGYQGRKLLDWLAEVDYSRPPELRARAGDALRQMGTNIIPFLLADLGDGNPLQLKYDGQDLRSPDDRLRQATWAFDALGVAGKPAIPQLEALLAVSPGYVPDALAGIGRDALPALLKALTNDVFWVRDNAAAALANAIYRGKIEGHEAAAALPIAISNLTYTNATNSLFQENTRHRAAGLLEAIRSDPVLKTEK